MSKRGQEREESQGPGRWSVQGSNGPRFSAPRLGAYLADKTPFAQTPGGELFIFRDGRYQPGGERSIKARVTEIMGDVWLPQHSNATLDWIRSRAPEFVEAPPINRVLVRNGMIEVTAEGAEFTEGTFAEYLTPVSLPVTYDPKARCPVLRKFLEQSVKDREVISLHQEITGYLMVPDNNQQKAFLNHGIEGAGKSKLIAAQVGLLGEYNCSAKTLHDLATNRFASHALYGKLLNASADISARELSSSATFREITGGDLIDAERKHQNSFSFRPYARLVFSANKFPTLSDPTQAMFDRWIVLPWTRKFRGTKAEDKDLLQKLTAPGELSGMLNWGLEGLVRLRRQGGFSRAALADRALTGFRRNADLVRMFLHEDGPRLPARVERGELFKKYVTWCDMTEHQPMGRNTFYNRVEQIVGKAKKTRTGSWHFHLG